LTVVDCSWRRAVEVFPRKLNGVARRLPLFVAANPTNYGQLGVLSSVEALTAGLHILGFKDEAEKIMSVFKWGAGFLSLNASPLDEYASCASREDVARAESEYFPGFSGASVKYPR